MPLLTAEEKAQRKMQRSKTQEKFREALPLEKKNVRVQHAKAQAECREAVTPEEKQEVKLPEQRFKG
jgi:hypothetical protein